MKIIDLYRKIVMKEELPKKVKYKNKIYILDNEIEKNPYTYKENGNWKTYLIGATLWNCPTDEVEIIEEKDDLLPNHIPNEFIQCLDNQDIKHIAHKVNEIINYLQHKSKEN